MNRPTFLPRAIAATLFWFYALGAFGPAHAQEGVFFKDVLSRIGVIPGDKDPIEYRERPSLVVPKNLDALRPPEQPEGHTKAAQWPKDPDVLAARERERVLRNPATTYSGLQDPSEGGRLSVDELRRGRAARGQRSTEAPVPTNERAGIRLPIEEIQAAGRLASGETYPPGTEPPRKYLTDPPTGLRLPASTAPVGKRTRDAPAVDTFRENPWKPIE